LLGYRERKASHLCETKNAQSTKSQAERSKRPGRDFCEGDFHDGPVEAPEKSEGAKENKGKGTLGGGAFPSSMRRGLLRIPLL